VTTAFSLGSLVIVINEADPSCGRRGTIEDIDEKTSFWALYGVRLGISDKLEPFWPSELQPVSVIDQLSELV